MMFRAASGLSRCRYINAAFRTQHGVHQLYASRSLASSSSKDTITIRWWYPVVGGLVITTAGGVKYFHDHVGGTEGLFRSLSFYSVAIPKYVEYRYHMWMQSPDEVWDDLDTETSKVALDKMLELEGFYIKCGQMCATNIGDAFPPIWQDTMSVLQDQVPPQPFETIKAVVESELDIDNTFASFDTEPIGSASIGQVHRATLKDGTKVVVKVCYPDVERLLRGDVRTIKTFAQVAQPVHVPALEEIEKQFQTEFDYRKEADHLALVRDNLTRAGLAGPNKLCQVPKPYMATKRVLVMEELFGSKLAVGLKEDMKHHASRAGKTVEEFMLAQKQKEQEHEERGETLRGPTADEMDLYIAILDSKRKMRNMFARILNVSTGWIPGFRRRAYEDMSVLPINHAKMVDDLLTIHGHEVLVDGAFNGDPHPGNILMCRTESGAPQLGLIDYGQVKKLSKDQRQLFAKLVIALDDDDRPEIVRLMKEAGFKSKRMDPEVIYLYARVGYDQDNKELTNGLHIQMFMEALEKRDPIEQLPKDFIMVSRASLMLRGLAHHLHQPRSVAASWRPIAERVIRENI